MSSPRSVEKKQYYEENKELIKAKARERYRKNKDTVGIKVKEQSLTPPLSSKEYYQKNKDRIIAQHKEYRKKNVAQHKEYRKKNADRIKKNQKVYQVTYRIEHKDKAKAYSKIYFAKPENKAKANKWTKKRYHSNPIFRLNQNMSGGIRQSLKDNNISKGGRHWETLVSYTKEQLKAHLESLFTEGMTLGNYGKWHIDHIIPKSAFNYTSTDDIEFRACWSLANLQPLWAKDNLAKGDKY